ncbi:MAG: MAPEG family protein [Rhodanobacter sp.]
MTIELTMLAWSVVLGLVQIGLTSLFSIAQRGTQWAAGARDNARPALKGIGGRVDRARANFLETFPFFVAVVLAAHVLQRHDELSVLGAQCYFWARLIYVPAYASGIPYLRTLVWAVSIVGIVLVLSPLL